MLALRVTADGTKLYTRPKMIPLGVRVTFDSPSVLAAQTKVFVNLDVIEHPFALYVGKGRAPESYANDQVLKAGHIWTAERCQRALLPCH